MAAWFLIPCLVELRSNFNAINPKRDKGADGSIGDDAHQAETSSDHNSDSQGRVLAVDIDSTGPWDGYTFDYLVQTVIARCRSGVEDRIEYIIWNHNIYSKSYDFIRRTYTGTGDPHTNHAHFSARHDHHGQNDTRNWEIEGDEMTDAQLEKLATLIADKIMHADAIPYTASDGTKDTWQFATAMGYLVGKVRDINTAAAAVAKNTNPPDVPATVKGK